MGKEQLQSLVDEVGRLYRDLEADLSAAFGPSACRRCGRCCDFAAFDHRLYVTTPEMIWFISLAGSPGRADFGRCPFLAGGECTVHPHRFAGCRIFSCSADKGLQGRFSEGFIAAMKDLCRRFELPYRYLELSEALSGADFFEKLLIFPAVPP